jgi:hypothetical protein
MIFGARRVEAELWSRSRQAAVGVVQGGVGFAHVEPVESNSLPVCRTVVATSLNVRACQCRRSDAGRDECFAGVAL